MDEVNDFTQVSDIISREEVEQFYALLQKMHKANAALEKLEQSDTEPKIPDGVVPYELAITVNCTVSQKESAVSLSPAVIEKLQKVYYIDMTTDNYSDMVEAFLDNITDALTNTCQKFIPPPTEDQTNV
jgi:hypothetical protein